MKLEEGVEVANYYPIFVDLENKPVLIVGGGNVAYRKVITLLDHGAIVRIVSPHILPELKALVDLKCCFWSEKEYEREDIKDAAIIFSCTEKDEVNTVVSRDAHELCRLINVVDDPEKCSFIVPSIMQQGELKIAVSTGGSSPIVARQIREQLEAQFDHSYAEYLDLLRGWRNKAKTELSLKQKQIFWAKITDGEVLEFVKNGQLNKAKGVIESCFRSLLD